MIADALFWTFHPFSPLSYGYYGYGYGAGYDGYVDRRQETYGRPERPKVPFYEKVNRFVFGPPQPKEDPHAARACILAEIRAQRGRITLADVMRVTGLPRDQADPLMARLMLDHDGEVDVAEGGGIVYRFEALRRSAGNVDVAPPPAAWDVPTQLPPLTGNELGSNIGIAALNGFNLLASAWVMSEGLTLSNLTVLFRPDRPDVLPDTSTPLALGLVPFAFSAMLFVLPIARAVRRRFEEKKLVAERARLEVLREVITHASRHEPITDEALRAKVRIATGAEPTSKEMTRHVVELGGDVDIGPEGEVKYRFAELEADAEAAREEREHAPEAEARLGQLVFASDR
jgi:hypothetical protein